MPKCLLVPLFLAVVQNAGAQTPRVPLDVSGVLASGPARIGAAIVDEGRRALLRGQETGSFTVWTADHVMRDVHLSFETTQPRQVIQGSSIAKSITARPEGTSIVYSHPAFTVREHIFVPLNAAAAMLLLQVDVVKPLNIVVHTPFGDSVISIDSARAATQYFPIVIAPGSVQPGASVQQYWQEKVAHFRRVRSNGISLESTDVRLNQALEWAKANLEQRLDRMAHVDAAQFYASYFILATFERWLDTDDEAFIRASWSAVQRALQIELRDGVRESSEQLRAAALDAVQQMARAARDAATERAAQTPPEDSASASLASLAFGLLEGDSADRVLSVLGAQAFTSDWGARVEKGGAVSPFMSGLAALAHYRQHRGWAGIDLLRDMARETFDFTRGRPPHLLSGAYYQTMPALAPQFMFETTMFVAPVVRGLIGWETDVAHHAAALEPHLPADLNEMAISGLHVGHDRIDVTLARDRGLYSIGIHRRTQGAPLSLRIAPALPLGAHVDRIVVNDQDVAAQSEETQHDVHAVAEIMLTQDAQIEVHYQGGVDVIATVEQIDVGEASHELKILDFRREGRDYLVTIEGVAASLYTLQLRSEQRVRGVLGADSFEQKQERVTIRVTLPSGVGFVRKTLRIKV